MPTTIDLCRRVSANCYVNASYDAARNGTCPARVDEFVVGFAWENGGGGRGAHPREPVAFPFPVYPWQTPAFFEHVALSTRTILDQVI